MAACSRWRLAAALLVVALSGLFSASSAQAAFPGDNGEIAFTRDATYLRGTTVARNLEIFTLAPGSTLATNRTNYPDAPDSEPAFSADGSKIAFTSQREAGTFSQIYTMNSDGTGLTRLSTQERDTSPAFSRDGEKIVFRRRAADSNDYDVYTMDAADGGNVMRLTSTPTATESDPTFFPSGSKIAFTRGIDLYTMNGDGSGEALLASNAFQADFSPDGTKIVFTRSGLSRDIYVMNADGSNQVNLTKTDSTNESEPVFSPDGTQIAYSISAEIYTMNADGSEPVNRSQHPDADTSPSWGVMAGTAEPVPATETQCSDGVDNDGDGKVDMQDPGCSLSEDDSEDPDPLPQCSDGQDNDADGKVDHPADPGCESSDDDSEADPPPPPEADLSVALTDDPDPVALYSNVTYTVMVTNKGPQEVWGDALTFKLTGAAHLISGSSRPSPNGTARASCGEPSGDTMGCYLYLDVGETVAVDVTARPYKEGQLTSVASVEVKRFDNTDPNLSDNSASETTTVGPGPPSLWSDTDEMTDARLFGHSATLLKDGKVLVAGGGGSDNKPLSSSELFDPKTGTWSKTTGALNVARMDHTATLLDDGRVIVVGGSDGRSFPDFLNSIEIYDPDTQSWTLASNTIWHRASGTATLLSGNRVLLIGGDGYFNPQTEIYDPALGGTRLSGALANDRNGHTATMFDGPNCAPHCGRVLVVGGDPDTFASQSRHTPEISDPLGETWVVTDDEVNRRHIGHSSTLLGSGRVLIAGGHRQGFLLPNVLAAAELYDPVSGTFSATGALAAPRHGHAAIRLPGGKVLVAGGRDDNGIPLSSAELYDSGAWSATGPMLRARAKPTSFKGYGDIRYSPNGPTATLLSGSEEVCASNCGRVLVVGGSSDKTAELYGETLKTADPDPDPPAPGTDSDPTAPGTDPSTTAPDSGTTTPGTGTSAPAPWPAPAPAPGAAGQAGVFTAKVSLARARIYRRDRVLDVFAPISARASGRVNVQLHAAGRRYRFTAPINSQDGRIRFRQRIPKGQADLGMGIVTLTYRGDADTRPQTVRLRAASRIADLRLSRPTLTDNGRLRAAGTIADRARGVVRVQLEYVTGTKTTTLQFKAPISGGRWSLNEQLSQPVRRAIAQRRGTLHSYTLFTGYMAARMRGEMRSFQVGLGAADGAAAGGSGVPGPVRGLTASARSSSEVLLSFLAAGSNGTSPPPARRYVVKQSLRPITSASDFTAAQTLCGNTGCDFEPGAVGERLTLTVDDLRAKTTYYYAVAARSNSGRQGPRSSTVRVTTK